MPGVQVGNRIIGADAPVTVGWENIGRVEGGPIKQFVFTYFQPAVLFGLIAFWYYAPNEWALASIGIAIGLGFKVLLLILEWVNPRYDSWRLTWKEFATDVFYVGLGYTLLRMVDAYIGNGVMIAAVQDAFDWDKFSWFTGLPLLLQALLISMIFDFGQYWMHRGMHNWYPLWLTHAPHHYITQLNNQQGCGRQPGRAVPDRAGHWRVLRFPAARFPAGWRDRHGGGHLSAHQRALQHAALVALCFSTRPSITASTIRRITRRPAAITRPPGSSGTASSAPASMARPNCWAWKADAGWTSAKPWSSPLSKDTSR